LQPDVPITVNVRILRNRPSPGLNVGHLTVTSGTTSVQVTVEAID
jgi:hypothetical protein